MINAAAGIVVGVGFVIFLFVAIYILQAIAAVVMRVFQ